ncbi:MAG: hypothetical protein R3F34_06010 [Planctomycetota bacterium]
MNAPLVALLLAVHVVAPEARGAAPTDAGEVDERFVSALDPKLDEETAAAQLASIGSNLPETVLAWVRPSEEAPEGHDLDDAAWRRIELAFDRHSRQPLARSLERGLAGPDEPRVARAGVRLLGAVGAAEQANLAIELSRELGSDAARPGLDAELFCTSVSRMQRRDGTTSAAFASLFTSIDPAWLVPIARSLAIGAAPEDLAFVWTGIERRGPAQPAFLSVLADVARLYVGRIADPELEKLRSRLRDADIGIVEHSVVCLGRLGDDECAEQLVALMSQRNSRIRKAAHWGMRELTGLPFGDDYRIWERWVDQGRAWWRDNAASLPDELRWGDKPVANARIVEIAKQRLRRNELVHLLATTFEREEDEVVNLAIRAIAQLRWSGTELFLVELLEHPSSRVQGRAWRALREVTGYDAGPEAEDWRRALAL